VDVNRRETDVRSGSKPEKLNASKCFPLFTQQRTSPRYFGMSEKCQERNSVDVRKKPGVTASFVYRAYSPAQNLSLHIFFLLGLDLYLCRAQ
jgi:hypothetical protein